MTNETEEVNNNNDVIMTNNENNYKINKNVRNDNIIEN